jgi:D-alanine-D-alanine ligase
VASPVAVCFGGPSPEHDISVLTGLQVARVLGRGGHDVIALYWSKTGTWHRADANLEAADFVDGAPRGSQELELVAGPDGGFFEPGRKRRPVSLDCVVVCCHGGPGEGGALQSAFDLAQIRYSGPTAAGAALGMDKLATNAIVAARGAPVNPQALIDDRAAESLTTPLIVKPRWGGSSLGIEVTTDLSTARTIASSSPHLRGGAVVEPFLDGWIDLNVAARTFPNAELSLIERPLGSGDTILTFDDKYLAGDGGLENASRELPANVPDAIEAEIRAIADQVMLPLGVRGIARLDFLWDGNDRVLFNEINTIPGAMSLYLWAASGHTHEQIVDDLVAEAREAPTTRWHDTGSDGRALRSAGTIASKLG